MSQPSKNINDSICSIEQKVRDSLEAGLTAFCCLLIAQKIQDDVKPDMFTVPLPAWLDDSVICTTWEQVKPGAHHFFLTDMLLITRFAVK